MKTKDLLNQKKPELEKVLGFYKTDVASIRSGRANFSLVENITVEAYGQKMHVNELGTITIPDPKSIVIEPWDKNIAETITSFIFKSGIGLNPVFDGRVIRLNIPPLTEERRKEFIKLLKQKTEDARVKIRRIREDLWHKIQTMERAREISEDEKFTAKNDLQKIVDEYNKKIEELEKKKESELMS